MNNNNQFDFEKRIKADMYIIGAVFCGNVIIETIYLPIISHLFYNLINNHSVSFDTVYCLNMAFSAIFNYALPLIVLGYIFRRRANEMSQSCEKTKPFKRILIIPAFFADYFVTITGAYISQIIIYFITSGYMPKDPFSGAMPVNITQSIAFFILVVLIAPIAEELIFRKFILMNLRKLGDVFAIIISAVLFALIHGNIMQIPYAFIGGIMLGYIAVWSGGVKAPIIVHMFFNAFEVLRIEYELINLFMLPFLVLGLISIIFFKKTGLFKQVNTCSVLTRSRKVIITYLNPLMLFCFFLFLLAILIAI